MNKKLPTQAFTTAPMPIMGKPRHKTVLTLAVEQGSADRINPLKGLPTRRKKTIGEILARQGRVRCNQWTDEERGIMRVRAEEYITDLNSMSKPEAQRTRECIDYLRRNRDK